MQRLKFYVACLAILFCASAAHANSITLYSGTGGALTGSTPWTTTVGGIVVNGYYWDGTNWQNGILFGRNEANDHGFGVCDPSETASCGTGSGGGDFNE